ncbi:hypothetical protein BDW60DRAFT_201064 [Aspergillus nidulans var. acristatus]
MHLPPKLHLLQYQSSMAMALNTNLPGTSFLPNHELLVILVNRSSSSAPSLLID